jgi:hypothetical protein
MNYTWGFVCLSLLLLPVGAAADIKKCVISGEIVFTNVACPDQTPGESVSVKPINTYKTPSRYRSNPNPDNSRYDSIRNKCKSPDGQWYPYGSKECSPDYSASKAEVPRESIPGHRGAGYVTEEQKPGISEEQKPVQSAPLSVADNAFVSRTPSNSGSHPKEESNVVGSSVFPERSGVELKQLLILGGWGILGTVIFLLALGLTNRVVIFYNAADAWWSISPFLFLVVTVIIVASLSPEGTKQFASTPIQMAVLSGGGLGVAFGVVMTFYNAIRYNQNLFLGLLIGVFKVIVSLLMAMTFLGSFRTMTDSRRTAREAVVAAFVVAIVGFLWSALVNGERVYRHKGWQPAEE